MDLFDNGMCIMYCVCVGFYVLEDVVKIVVLELCCEFWFEIWIMFC